jgi:hypothetical protein
MNKTLLFLLSLPIIIPTYVLPGHSDFYPIIYMNFGVGIDSIKNIAIKIWFMYRF